MQPPAQARAASSSVRPCPCPPLAQLMACQLAAGPAHAMRASCCDVLCVPTAVCYTCLLQRMPLPIRALQKPPAQLCSGGARAASHASCASCFRQAQQSCCLRAVTAGTSQTFGTDATPTNQASYYKQTYQYAQDSILNGGPLRGIAFWRWDGINSEGSLSDTNNALTLSARQTLARLPGGCSARPCSSPWQTTCALCAALVHEPAPGRLHGRSQRWPSLQLDLRARRLPSHCTTDPCIICCKTALPSAGPSAPASLWLRHRTLPCL